MWAIDFLNRRRQERPVAGMDNACRGVYSSFPSQQNRLAVGSYPDTIARIQGWIFDNGPAVPAKAHYLRAFQAFDVDKGQHDSLMRHMDIGIGHRRQAGNTLGY